MRVWLSSAVLFDTDPDTKTERLTDDGKARLDSAIAPCLDRITNCIVIIEGYSRLDPQATGVMPLGREASDSPSGKAWDGIAVAVFIERG